MDGRFDPHVHEALLAQPGEGAEPGSVLQVCRRATGSATRCSGPPGSWSRSSRWPIPIRRSAFHGRRQTTRSRRPTASSRASCTPTATPETRRPRSASRTSRRAYDLLSDAEKRKQYDTYGESGSGAFGGVPAGRRGLPCRERRPRRPVGSARRHGWHRRHLRPRPARAGATSPAARRRSRGARADLVRGRPQGSDRAGSGGGRDGMPRVRRHGRRPGNYAEDLSAVPGVGGRLRQSRSVRAVPALPALPRQRRDHREALQELPRHRPRADHEALPGEDSCRRQGRDADQAEGEGRARPQRRPGRRPLRRRAGRVVGAVRATWLRSRARCARSRIPRPRSARRSRSRHPTARSR